MERTVLHRPIQPLVPEHRMAPEYGRREQKEDANLFIALGMQSSDPGFKFVVRNIEELGEVAHFNEGLLYTTSHLSIDKAFKRINECLTDPRIDCDTPLVVIDPKKMRAKWYLSLEVSAVLNENWRKRNNLFICQKDQVLQKSRMIRYIQALGVSARISKSIWYVSSAYSPGEAFKILSKNLEVGNRLTVFDAMGRVKSWQTEPGRLKVQLARPHENRPARASIHKPHSWQEQALAEFL